MRALADEVVCLATPARFYGIGQWYQDFHQVSDEEVRDYLAPFHPASEAAGPAPGAQGAL